MDADYLRKCLGEILPECLAEVAEKRSRDPIEYIALWLKKSVADKARVAADAVAAIEDNTHQDDVIKEKGDRKFEELGKEEEEGEGEGKQRDEKNEENDEKEQCDDNEEQRDDKKGKDIFEENGEEAKENIEENVSVLEEENFHKITDADDVDFERSQASSVVAGASENDEEMLPDLESKKEVENDDVDVSGRDSSLHVEGNEIMSIVTSMQNVQLTDVTSDNIQTLNDTVSQPDSSDVAAIDLTAVASDSMMTDIDSQSVNVGISKSELSLLSMEEDETDSITTDYNKTDHIPSESAIVSKLEEDLSAPSIPNTATANVSSSTAESGDIK